MVDSCRLSSSINVIGTIIKDATSKPRPIVHPDKQPPNTPGYAERQTLCYRVWRHLWEATKEYE
eukprot:5519691-Heterocapsa_arctica.AAC.1